MDILPRELRRSIFDLCDLESLVSLRQANRFFYNALEDFDDTLIRDKVIKRAPWFETGFDRDNWMQCARLIVNRSAAVLNGMDYETEWFLVKDIRAAMRISPETTYVKPDNFHKMTSESKLMFPDSLLRAPGKYHVKGSKLLVKGLEMDLSTRLTDAYDEYDPDNMVPPLPSSKPEVTSPSGLKLQSHDKKTRIRVLDENDKLLLVRIRQEGDRATDTLARTRDVEHIVHKESCPRDDDGVLIIDRKNLLTIGAIATHGVSVIKLLPGAGGALVNMYYNEGWSYLAYVEPTKDLRHVVICFVPCIHRTVSMEETKTRPNNYIFYDGFFFFYFGGRLFRLWVDLGYETRIPRRQVPDNRRLPQPYDTQCLTGCHPFYHAMGTFCEQDLDMDRHTLVQGSKEQGLDHYVTVRRSGGYVVGDLKTGHTWQVNEFCPQRQLMIPYLEKGKVKFFTMDHRLCGLMQMKLGELYPQRHERFDWSSIYSRIVSHPAITQPDESRFPRLELYYSDDGEANPADFGPYLDRSVFHCGDACYNEPEDYETAEHHEKNWEDYVFPREEDDDLYGYDDDFDDDDEFDEYEEWEDEEEFEDDDDVEEYDDEDGEVEEDEEVEEDVEEGGIDEEAEVDEEVEGAASGEAAQDDPVAAFFTDPQSPLIETLRGVEDYNTVVYDVCERFGSLSTTDPKDPKNQHALVEFLKGLRDGQNMQMGWTPPSDFLTNLAYQRGLAKGTPKLGR